MTLTDDPYVECLSSLSGAKVYMKPYLGNSGDSLIWMGNEALFSKLGIARTYSARDADVILWPGGNPTMWRINIEGWQECWRKWPEKRFVVAPATFHANSYNWQQLLRDSAPNLMAAFARDPQSFQNLTAASLKPNVKIGLADDPAFHLRDSEWIAKHREGAAEEYVLASFREDHESSYRPPRERRFTSRWPISAIVARRAKLDYISFQARRLGKVRELSDKNAPIVHRDAPMMSFEAFVECVRDASAVHTDRLHCMILAVMLGKKVFCYPTSYGKLEAVYEQSMKTWAPVTFVSI